MPSQTQWATSAKILLQHPITKYQPQPSLDISNTSKCRHLNPSINTLASFMPYIQYIAELPPYICSTSGRLGNPTHLVCHLYAMRTISNDSADAAITHSIPCSRLGGVRMPPYWRSILPQLTAQAAENNLTLDSMPYKWLHCTQTRVYHINHARSQSILPILSQISIAA